jgi:histidyl-tRNA synthetase
VSSYAPNCLDYLCKDCAEHFEKVKKNLDIQGIEYIVNSRIVRGLDYYTRTVFEFVCNDENSFGTICGGGRYDGLVEELGGPALPALGFGFGMERLLLVMDRQKIERNQPECQLYMISVTEKAQQKMLELAKIARKSFISTEYDLMGRSLGSQMKYANKIGAKFVLVLGEEELKTGEAKLKNMKTGQSNQIKTENEQEFLKGLHKELYENQN